MAFNTLRFPLALVLLGAHGMISPSTGRCRDLQKKQYKKILHMRLFSLMLKMRLVYCDRTAGLMAVLYLFAFTDHVLIKTLMHLLCCAMCQICFCCVFIAGCLASILIPFHLPGQCLSASALKR